MNERPEHVMTTGVMAGNEARALRLVLACVRGETNPEEAIQVARAVWDELECEGCVQHVAEILARMVADQMMDRRHGEKKAARQLEKRIASLLDFWKGKPTVGGENR